MKKILFFGVLAAASYGIYRSLETYATPVATAPATQLKEGKAAEDMARRVTGQATVESVQRAVNGFRDANGRFPSSLQELVDKGLLESVPGGVTYDPATGTVSAG